MDYQTSASSLLPVVTPEAPLLPGGAFSVVEPHDGRVPRDEALRPRLCNSQGLPVAHHRQRISRTLVSVLIRPPDSRSWPAVAFKAPKQSAFKQFVILDADGVVSALSAIDGGQIDEILTRSAEERDGGFAGGVEAGPIKAKGKKSKTRKVEEEIRRARTRHATAAKLLDALHERDSIGIVDGPLDEAVASQLKPGMVIEFRAQLRLHPLYQADQMLKSFLEVGPKLGQKKIAQELRQNLEIWGVVTGTGREGAPVLLEPYTEPTQIPRLLLPVPAEDFEAEIDAVLKDVTLVAQVEQVIDDDQSYQVVRVLRGGDPTSLERGVVDEMLPSLIEGMAAIGVTVTEDDVNVKGPAIVLRAICAYR
jgi:hypothetical protein